MPVSGQEMVGAMISEDHLADGGGMRQRDLAEEGHAEAIGPRGSKGGGAAASRRPGGRKSSVVERVAKQPGARPGAAQAAGASPPAFSASTVRPFSFTSANPPSTVIRSG